MPRAPPCPLYTLKNDLNPVHSVCFWSNSKNEKLFAGCQSGQVQLWSLQSNRNIEGLQAHSGPCISVSCYGPNLITQGKGDGHVKSWHTLEGGGWAPNYNIYTRHSMFCRFAILDQNNDSASMLICPEEDYSVAVYSTNTGEKMSNLNMSDFKVNSKSLGYIMTLKPFYDPSTMRPMLLVAHEGGQISLRDLFAGGQEICRLSVGEPVLCLEYDPVDGVGVYGSPGSTFIRKFSIDVKTGISDLGSHTAITNPGISCIQLRPDSKILATGGWDGRLRLFSWHRNHRNNCHAEDVSLSSLSKTEVLNVHPGSKETNVGTVAIDMSSPLVSSENNEHVSAKEESYSSSLVNKSSPVDGVTLSTEKVPSIKKAMKHLAVLKQHTKSIQSIAFSNGPVESWDCACLFVAGSDDGEISLWDLFN